jgi:hypothetical protein
MSRTQGSLVRKVVAVGLVTLALTPAAWAQTSAPATGLGQSWPNAADVSTNPNWHVYVFVLNGVKYVQVNDLNGTVHAAIGTASGAAIVLPVGVDASNVVATTSSSAGTSSVVVYSDSATTITATPLSSGATQFVTHEQEECGSAYSCTGGSVSKQIQVN